MDGFSSVPNFIEKHVELVPAAQTAGLTEGVHDPRRTQSILSRREHLLRRRGQKLLGFWVRLVIRLRDRATPSEKYASAPRRERRRERTFSFVEKRSESNLKGANYFRTSASAGVLFLLFCINSTESYARLRAYVCP